MNVNKNNNKIAFVGGGSGGSVSPLLAVAEELMNRWPDWQYLFFGTKFGPEKEMIAEADLPNKFIFLSLPAGKWRRYFSWKTFLDPVKIISAFFISLTYLRRYRPRAVVSAGSFNSPPLAWAAFFCRIPVLIHQQDIRPGLANRLMAPIARQISVVFSESLKVYGSKAILVGNPIRLKILEKAFGQAREFRNNLGLSAKRPLLAVIGGGTGALALNKLMADTWPLIKNDWQIVQISGVGKMLKYPSGDFYHQFSFLPSQQLLSLMVAADLIISRAGLGVLTEISAVAKPAIIIPMPNSHQEDNAAAFDRQQAALVFKQADLSAQKLKIILDKFRADPELAECLARRVAKVIPRNSGQRLADILESWVKDYEKK